MASPFTWNLTKPALSDIVANFPTQVDQPDKTTLATVLGTLNPFGTTTTGWRANQVNDSLWAAQNAAATGLLPSPGTPTLTASTTGGSLATGTVYVKVTALDVLNGLETAPSPETSVAVTGPSASVAVSWTAVSGAGAYRVYVGSTAGGENAYFQTTGTSYTVTTLSGTSGTPPTATLAGTYNRDDTTKASLTFATDPSLSAWRWLYAAGAANPITWTEVMRLTSAGALSVSSTLNAGSGSANYLQFLGVPTGSVPQVAAQGSDTNVGINLITKGTGQVLINGVAIAGWTAQIEQSVSTSIPNGGSSFTVVGFTAAATVDANTGSLWSPSSPTRFTAQVAGKYLLIGQVRFPTQTVGAGTCWVAFAKNGGYVNTVGQFTQAYYPTSAAISLQATTLLTLAANDYIELVAYQNSGVAQSLTQAAFAMYYIGQ